MQSVLIKIFVAICANKIKAQHLLEIFAHHTLKHGAMNTSSLSSDPTPWQMVYQGADQILRKAQGLIASDKLADFMASVRWNEPFIRGVIAMQTALFLLSYLTRRNEVAQFGVLLVLTVVTLGAERINEYGSRNWSKFATQDYFDSSGLFMMVFVSGPFVVLANFIVVRVSFFSLVFACVSAWGG